MRLRLTAILGALLLALLMALGIGTAQTASADSDGLTTCSWNDGTGHTDQQTAVYWSQPAASPLWACPSLSFSGQATIVLSTSPSGAYQLKYVDGNLAIYHYYGGGVFNVPWQTNTGNSGGSQHAAGFSYDGTIQVWPTTTWGSGYALYLSGTTGTISFPGQFCGFMADDGYFYIINPSGLIGAIG